MYIFFANFFIERAFKGEAVNFMEKLHKSFFCREFSDDSFSPNVFHLNLTLIKLIEENRFLA